MSESALFFRIDASPHIGLGHLRRCAVLARACYERGARAHFIIRSEGLDLSQQDFPPETILHAIPWDCSPEEDAQFTVEISQKHGITEGVVDHYRFTEASQKILNAGGLRWMQFGNLLHTHPLLGTWVHDANPGADAAAYADRVTSTQPTFLTGPRYALVGEAFRHERSLHPPPVGQDIETILLTFGGGDDRGAALAALAWLDAAGYQGKRLLLTTRLNPHLSTLQQKASESAQIELHVDNWHPAPLMARCQLALSAGGTSLHELACLGVPPVIVSIADNQLSPAKAWHEAGLAINLGSLPTLSIDDAAAQLKALLQQPDHRLTMARQCWEAQDGCGADRVAAALIGV